MAFDFSGLRDFPPQGLRVAQANKVRLELIARSGSHWIVTSPRNGEFELHQHGTYDRSLVFVLRSDSLGHVLGQLGYNTKEKEIHDVLSNRNVEF